MVISFTLCEQSIDYHSRRRVLLKDDAYQILRKVEELETSYSRDRSINTQLGSVQVPVKKLTAIRRALANYLLGLFLTELFEALGFGGCR